MWQPCIYTSFQIVTNTKFEPRKWDSNVNILCHQPTNWQWQTDQRTSIKRLPTDREPKRSGETAPQWGLPDYNWWFTKVPGIQYSSSHSMTMELSHREGIFTLNSWRKRELPFGSKGQSHLDDILHFTTGQTLQLQPLLGASLSICAAVTWLITNDRIIS